jgi:hypothetical protein
MVPQVQLSVYSKIKIFPAFIFMDILSEEPKDNPTMSKEHSAPTAGGMCMRSYISTCRIKKRSGTSEILLRFTRLLRIYLVLPPHIRHDYPRGDAGLRIMSRLSRLVAIRP